MKQLFLLLAMVLGLVQAYGQLSVNFCARVDQNGYCLFNNTKFFLSPDSTSSRIFVEVTQPQTFSGTSKITIKFYKVEANGDEKYTDSLEQKVQDTWVYAWIPHEFMIGKYDIKIYDDKNQLLVSRKIELFG